MRNWINLIVEASLHATIAPDHIASREPTPIGQHLFHGTPLPNALAILRDNDISTGIDWRGEGDRVALTRNYNVAAEFGTYDDYDNFPVVFVLDWAKLVEDYIVRPHVDPDVDGGVRANDEEEEAVYGHIDPLSQYLVSVNIDPALLQEAYTDDDFADYCVIDKPLFDNRKELRYTLGQLMVHPKLNAWKPS